MSLEMLKAFFMWCTIINIGLMMISFVLLTLCSDWVYRVHSKWFPISRVAFNTILYSFMGVYKLLVFVFCIVPWIALCIIG